MNCTHSLKCDAIDIIFKLILEYLTFKKYSYTHKCLLFIIKNVSLMVKQTRKPFERFYFKLCECLANAKPYQKSVGLRISIILTL